MAHIRTTGAPHRLAMMVRRTPERDRKYLESNDNFCLPMISRQRWIAIMAAG
jgi:hypothetical protein